MRPGSQPSDTEWKRLYDNLKARYGPLEAMDRYIMHQEGRGVDLWLWKRLGKGFFQT